jgi:hypothetical protein
MLLYKYLHVSLYVKRTIIIIIILGLKNTSFYNLIFYRMKFFFKTIV